MRPTVLGAFCDVLATALRNEAKVKLASMPRMADFAICVVAAEPACPWTLGQFLQVYTGNREQAAQAVLEGKPIAQLVRTLIGNSTETPKQWTGTASELFEELKLLFVC